MSFGIVGRGVAVVAAIVAPPHSPFPPSSFGWLSDAPICPGARNINMHVLLPPIGQHVDTAGLLTYRRYWTDVILEYLSSHDDDTVSIENISDQTALNVFLAWA